jgi:hypothetical protein
MFQESFSIAWFFIFMQLMAAVFFQARVVPRASGFYF